MSDSVRILHQSLCRAQLYLACAFFFAFQCFLLAVLVPDCTAGLGGGQSIIVLEQPWAQVLSAMGPVASESTYKS